MVFGQLPRAQGLAGAVAYLADLLTVTNAQMHHAAQGGPQLGPLKPSEAPRLLGFPLYEPQ